MRYGEAFGYPACEYCGGVPVGVVLSSLGCKPASDPEGLAATCTGRPPLKFGNHDHLGRRSPNFDKILISTYVPLLL